MLGAVLALVLSQNPATMGPGSAAAVLSPPALFFTALTSAPATECDGSAVSGITFTRASTLTYCEASDTGLYGLSANQPRVNSDGLVIEGARTNLVIRSEEFDNAAWTKSNVTVGANGTGSPASTLTAESFLTTASGGFVQSTAFIPNFTTGTASIYVSDTGIRESFSVVIRDTTAGVDRATCNFTTLANVWGRFYCNVTGLTSANNLVFKFYPGGTSGAQTDGIYAWGAQFETPLSNFATTYIPTTTASANRAIDVATWSNATDISTQGCLSATVTFGQSGEFGGAILSNGTEMMLGTSDNTHIKINDGTTTVTALVPDMSGRTVTLRSHWSGTSMTVESVTDAVSASGTFDGFSSTSTMRIGATTSVSGYASATIKAIKAGSTTSACN